MMSHYIPLNEFSGGTSQERDRDKAGKDIKKLRKDRFNEMSFDEVKKKTFIQIRYRTCFHSHEGHSHGKSE